MNNRYISIGMSTSPVRLWTNSLKVKLLTVSKLVKLPTGQRPTATLHNNYVFNLARLSYGTDNLTISYRRNYSSDKSKTFEFITSTEFRTKLPKKIDENIVRTQTHGRLAPLGWAGVPTPN